MTKHNDAVYTPDVAKEATIMFLHKRLKIARIQARLSQERLAQKLCMADMPLSKSTLASWERGITKPDIDQLEKVAACLNKQIFFFLALKTQQNDMLRIRGA